MSVEIWTSIDAAIVTAIQGLGLEGEEAADNIGNRVYSLLYPDGTDMTYPCVQVTQEGLTEKLVRRTSEADQWEYPNWVYIADSGVRGDVLHRRKYLYMRWRKAILSVFDGKRLAGVAEVIGCSVDPNVFIDRALPQYQHVISGMIVKVQTNERRTVAE